MARKSKTIRYILYFFSVFVVIIGAFGYWALGKSLPKKSSYPVDRWPNAPIGAIKATVTVMTYNMGHGQGVKDLPWDWRGEEITKMQLGELADVIKRVNADFVFLQEVDLNSKRTQYINEAEFLLKRTHYPYSACATVWDKNYLPFPYWPIEHHIGKVLAANCIFSKYPLKNHESIIFDKPASNAFWYNWGYIDRGAQKVIAQIGDKKLTLINTHFEAWEKEARIKQVKAVTEWIKELPGPTIFGGDLNTLPPEACKKNQFVDELDVDFNGDHTIELLRSSLPGYFESLTTQKCPSSGYNSEELNTFTYPADAPTRRLDYLYTTKGARILSERVVKEAGTASDHLPVWAEIAYY